MQTFVALGKVYFIYTDKCVVYLLHVRIYHHLCCTARTGYTEVREGCRLFIILNYKINDFFSLSTLCTHKHIRAGELGTP